MKSLALLSIMMVIAIILSCRTIEESSAPPLSLSTESYQKLDLVHAVQVLRTVCTSCHSEPSPASLQLAPPLYIVKNNYLKKTKNESDFVEKMVQFITYPTHEQAELHAEIEQYGLMDPVGYSKEELQSIAVFLYHNNLNKPDWLKIQEE